MAVSRATKSFMIDPLKRCRNKSVIVAKVMGKVRTIQKAKILATSAKALERLRTMANTILLKWITSKSFSTLLKTAEGSVSADHRPRTTEHRPSRLVVLRDGPRTDCLLVCSDKTRNYLGPAASVKISVVII